MKRNEIIEILKSIKLPVQEDAVSDVFGNIAFGDRDTQDDAIPIAKLQGKPLPKPKGEPNTSKEDNLYNLLRDWVDSPSDYLATAIYKYRDLIKAAQKKFPNIFAPDSKSGTILYRGLKEINPKIRKMLLNSKETDWISIERGDAYVYSKPIKYTPTRVVQSWTDDLNIALGFKGEAILITKQTENFMFNQKLLAIVFRGRNEHETLHMGKEYASKVYIAISDDRYESLVKGNKAKGRWKDLAKIVGLSNKKAKTKKPGVVKMDI